MCALWNGCDLSVLFKWRVHCDQGVQCEGSVQYEWSVMCEWRVHSTMQCERDVPERGVNCERMCSVSGHTERNAHCIWGLNECHAWTGCKTSELGVGMWIACPGVNGLCLNFYCVPWGQKKKKDVLTVTHLKTNGFKTNSDRSTTQMNFGFILHQHSFVISCENFIHFALLVPKYFPSRWRYGYYKQSKKISNDQELIQSDPTSCPINQKGNN